jgi:hypothetical protein
MMDHIDGRRFKQIDPLSHQQTTQERVKSALCIFGGACVFLLAFCGVLALSALAALLNGGAVS